MHSIVVNAGSGAAAPRNVVLLHGFGAGLGFWFRNVAPLAAGLPHSSAWRIFAVDWLGMGRSSRPRFPRVDVPRGRIDADNQPAIDFFLDALEAWRAQQQPPLERFTLVGHSLGGYLAGLYALRHPERIDKLVLVSPVGIPPFPNEPDLAVTGFRMPSWVSAMWHYNVTPQFLVRAAGPFGPHLARRYTSARFGHLPDDENAKLASYVYHICADTGSGEYSLNSILAPGAWARKPLGTQLARLHRTPITFMYGEADWMDYRDAHRVAQQMAADNKPRIVRIHNAGHQLFLENPAEFNRLLLQELS